MLRAGREAVARVQSKVVPPLSVASRNIGDKGVPPEFGQPKEGGTGFLGTPENHQELLEKRPLSPDVFGLDGGTHYKFPLVALSSITHRVTGVALSGIFGLAGGLALAGELTPAVEAAKGLTVLCPLLKFSLSFPFAYHYLSGLRHLVYDEVPKLVTLNVGHPSSIAMLGSSAAIALGLAAYPL